MTSDIVLALSGLTGIAVVALAALRGWNGWLDLKRLELERAARGEQWTETGNLIELADMRERLRRLEAIAAGVDL